MGRRSPHFLTFILLAMICLAGCGSSHSTASGPLATTISLSPTSATLEMGQTQQLSATAQNFDRQTITIPITFSSNNTAVLTVSNGGLACAGSWDSLTVPVNCTPGPAGVALVTASAGGVTSGPATIYVHSHIDNISISPILPLPVLNCTPPGNTSTVDLSQSQVVNYQATAFSHGNDITGTVGPFTWAQSNASVVKLNSSATGLLNNQVQATALTPGLSHIFASAGGVTSSAVDFETCPVTSITLSTSGGSGNVLDFGKAGTATISATVTDSTGTVLSTLPSLTWSSSDPLVASAAANGNLGGTATAHASGGATVIASCTPPSCNGGFVPLLPIYPNTAITVTVAPSGTPATTSAYVTTSDCADKFGCSSTLVAIAVPANTIGNSATLPNTPNSFVFDRQGKTAYLGSTHGLMVFLPSNLGSSTNPITVHGNVTGKVLAVSHDGSKVIVSDTASTPNQVFVFDTTGTNSAVNLLISGAKAAAFSPDDLKAYIVAGSNLYVYSTLEPLQTISLAAAATDVTFLPQGIFAELAGGTNSGVAVTNVATCTDTNPVVAPITTNGTTNSTPTALRALIDGTHLLALDPPGIDVVTVTVPATNPACPPSISNISSNFVDLGQGQFTQPVKFLVASDSTKAYVIVGNFGAVPVYDVAGGVKSAIPLTGNATVVDGDLTLDGTLLYVSASDGAVHAINTGTAREIQTISFPPTFTFCNNVTFACKPDLLVVQP